MSKQKPPIEDDIENLLAFSAISTPRDVATVLEIPYSALVYLLYGIPPVNRYTSFYISKRSGEKRKISVPLTAIKTLQRRLNRILTNIHACYAKATTHGFVMDRNVRTNAKSHTKKKYVFNLDLKNFFPSINFGRVRGAFMAHPFEFNSKVSTVLAQICCHDNELPQGAPTSPIISNFICAKMDSQIMALAKRSKCSYSRYADDLTFSTNSRTLPKEIAVCKRGEKIQVGDKLEKIIKQNGFSINPNKTRLAMPYQRQAVTGLTVNEFPNPHRKLIRKVRAMLHAWEKFGLDKAEEKYYESFSYKEKNPRKKRSSFQQIVIGKINYIKLIRKQERKLSHKDAVIHQRMTEEDSSDDRNHLHRKLLSRYEKLWPPFKVDLKYNKSSTVPLIITEGKTDWKHLKAALKALRANEQYSDLNIEIMEYIYTMGDDNLWSLCEALALRNKKRQVICLFDRDNPKIIAKFGKEKFRKWPNNVYAATIPVPSHRQSNAHLSIEMYYNDNDIKRKDEEGKRLFLSTEFNTNGEHLSESGIKLDNKNSSNREEHVIDSRVWGPSNQTVVLKKNEYAENILNQKKGFADMDFSEYSKIFDLIVQMIADAAPTQQNGSVVETS